MNFLTAEWRKLVMINFIIPPEIINDYVPKGTKIDLWNGNCYVSLVGFMFLNTRVLGIPIPFHINFEEVNLRFYVKREENNLVKRGVVFIKEIVPKNAITFVANTLYKENYKTLPMYHQWNLEDDLAIKYNWKFKNKNYFMVALASSKKEQLGIGTEAEFIAEHYWGYTKVNPLKTTEYEVTHPKWEKYQLKDYNYSIDFGELYGEGFSLLNELKPSSVFLVEGSEIAVQTFRTIH